MSCASQQLSWFPRVAYHAAACVLRASTKTTRTADEKAASYFTLPQPQIMLALLNFKRNDTDVYRSTAERGC